MKVFIGGSEAIKKEKGKQWELTDSVKICLYDLITNADEILVGDGTGVDWLVQKYLDDLHYKKVTVYTYGGNKCCRSNVGAWEEKKHRLVGNTLLTSKIERDFYLIEDADYGIIIWDGECRESYICMLYLISIGKKCRLYLMSEDNWTDIESIEELSNFAGDEGTIDREDVREVLERCGFSEQMIEYSVANDTISTWKLAEIICQAPIKLDEKLYCLSYLGRKRNLKYEVFNSVSDNMKKCVPYKRIKHDIRALVDYRGEESIWMYYWDLYHKIKAAKDEMHDFEDIIIDKPAYLFNEWYDKDELMIKSSPCGMFATIKQALAYIKNEQKEDGTEDDYYRIEVWNPYEGTREQPRYDYYVYKGEICWFEVLYPQKQENGNAYYMRTDRHFSSGKHDLNISTPYKPGDIVLIDCKPFGPRFYAMILEARNQYDCCMPTILFNVFGTDKWRITSLKHKRFYKDISCGTFGNLLSPLYRLRKVEEDDIDDEDLPYSVEDLFDLSEHIDGSEEIAEYLWNYCNEKGYDDMNDRVFYNLFFVLAEHEIDISENKSK